MSHKVTECTENHMIQTITFRIYLSSLQLVLVAYAGIKRINVLHYNIVYILSSFIVIEPNPDFLIYICMSSKK